MNRIKEVVMTNSDEEILKTYRTLESLGECEGCFRLRVEFLLYKLYRCNDVDWSGVSRYFIEEETKDIQNKKTRIASLTRRAPQLILTRINPFLNAKLMKEGIIETDLSVVNTANSKQGLFLSNGTFTKKFSEFCLSYYLGEESKLQLIKLMTVSSTRHIQIKGILGEFNSNRSITAIEAKVEDLYKRNKDRWQIKGQEFDYIREQLLILFAYNWYIGNLLSAEFFLMKALRIMSHDDSLFEVCQFLNKELFNQLPLRD